MDAGHLFQVKIFYSLHLAFESVSDFQSFTATMKCTSRNEKTGRFHKILAPNLYVRVFPNGDVLYRCILYSQCYCGQSHQQSHHIVTRSSSLFILSELTQTGTVIICLTIPTRGSLCNTVIIWPDPLHL